VKLSQKKQIPDDRSIFHGIKSSPDHVEITIPSQKTKVKLDDRQNNSANKKHRTSQNVQGRLSSEMEHARHADKKQSSVLLLMWTHPWNVNSEGPKEGWKSGNCSLTCKREFLEEADAVIFPYMTAPRKWSLPR